MELFPYHHHHTQDRYKLNFPNDPYDWMKLLVRIITNSSYDIKGDPSTVLPLEASTNAGKEKNQVPYVYTFLP